MPVHIEHLEAEVDVAPEGHADEGGALSPATLTAILRDLVEKLRHQEQRAARTAAHDFDD